MVVSLLMTSSLTLAEGDKSDMNPKGAGVVKIGNQVSDVCECNASSAPLLPKEQYKHLLPDDAGDGSGPRNGSSATGTN